MGFPNVINSRFDIDGYTDNPVGKLAKYVEKKTGEKVISIQYFEKREAYEVTLEGKDGQQKDLEFSAKDVLSMVGEFYFNPVPDYEREEYEWESTLNAVKRLEKL